MVTQTTSPTPDNRGSKRPKHGEEHVQVPPPMGYYPQRGPPPVYQGGPMNMPPGMPPHGGPMPPYGWHGGYGVPQYPGGPPPPGHVMPYHPRGPMGRPPPPDYWNQQHHRGPPPGYPSNPGAYGVAPGHVMRRSNSPPRSRSFAPAREDMKDTDDGTASVATSSSNKDKSRGSYKCGRCGVPKKGHICPYQPKIKRKMDEPPPETRNAAIQVEIDEFMTLRRLNIRIQGLPESYATEADPYMGEPMVVGEPHPVRLPPQAEETAAQLEQSALEPTLNGNVEV